MDFRAFEATPGIHVIVYPDSPVYTCAAVSNDFILESATTRKDVVGKGLFEILAKTINAQNVSASENLKVSLENVVTTRQQHEVRLQLNDVMNGDAISDQKYLKFKNTPVLGDSGDLLYIIHSTVDITEETIARQKADSSKGIEKAYNFFVNAPVIIGFVRGEDYVIELANEGLLEVWGRTAEVIGKPLVQAIPELEEQGFKELLDRVCQTGEPFYAYEYPIKLVRNKKEEVLYFDFVYKPLYEDETNRTVAGVISVGHEVTEKVLARKRVRETEERYRTLFDSMDQGYCTVEVLFAEGNEPIDYRFLETNPVFEKQSGLVNAVGKTIRELVPGIEAQWFKHYGNVALTGESIRFVEESKAIGKWFEVFAFPVGEGDSRKVGVFFTDITSRKKTEEALKLSESNLRNMILQSPVAMAIFRGPEFVVELANDRMFELFGRGKDEVLNKSIFEGVPEAKNQGYEELLANVFTTGKTFSALGIPVTLPRAGGVETVYINLLYEPFKEGDGTIAGIMAVATDVTDQVKARIKIEESAKELQFAMDVMPQMVWVTLPDGYHEFYNKQWFDYTGLSHEQSANAGWNTVLHPDDQQRAWEVWRHSLQTGGPYEIEYRFKRFDGVYRWFLGRALPLKDSSGNIVKWFGTCTDIEDQKIAAQLMEETVKERTRELQITIHELERSNSNLEEFAYAASHDLKEPIRKIRTFSDRIKQQLKERLLEDDMHYFQRMDKATERMQILIEDLLAYSHVATNDNLLEDIDLNKKVSQVLEDLELEVAEKKARIIVGTLPVVRGHRRQMQQLFQNLITNALKFRKPGEVPEVRITSSIARESDINSFRISEGAKNRRYNLVEISDNGIGFEQEYAEKIFKMFQRLHGKAEYEGTGIGLAIVRKVVENHQGFIMAEGRPGEGATFKVLLPVLE